MSAPFQPGDVVVCVDTSANFTGGRPDNIQKGAHYRIEVGSYPDPDHGRPIVRLVGLHSGDWTGAYLASRFRKIDDETYPEVLERLKALGKQRERVS
ncbi:MAG: hypothetical protein EON59_00705 [Alphaproteobacteria bacterium]|nr:MAG: hypothetical protein EON59_00705 [Alphaproteobacteria bacterium]